MNGLTNYLNNKYITLNGKDSPDMNSFFKNKFQLKNSLILMFVKNVKINQDFHNLQAVTTDLSDI